MTQIGNKLSSVWCTVYLHTVHMNKHLSLGVSTCIKVTYETLGLLSNTDNLFSLNNCFSEGGKWTVTLKTLLLAWTPLIFFIFFKNQKVSKALLTFFFFFPTWNFTDPGVLTEQVLAHRSLISQGFGCIFNLWKHQSEPMVQQPRGNIVSSNPPQPCY